MNKSINYIKWWPIITNLVILVAFLFALFGIKIYDITSPLFGVCLLMCYYWWRFSIDFKFCLWHRILIANLSIVSIVVLFNNIAIRFDCGIKNLTLIRLVLSTTIVLSLIAFKIYYKNGTFKKTSFKSNRND